MAETHVYTYEMMYIINAVLSDDQIKSVRQRVEKYIKENGGEILETEELGNRRLAYPIRKKRNGHYVNVYFEAPGDIVPKLERALQIADEVLRYLTLRMDAKMLSHYEQRKQKAAAMAAAAAAESEDES